MPTPVTPIRCGFYGKLPMRGDFVRRGLSDDFVTAWDAWIEAGLVSFKLHHGEGWLPRYLEAPIWHFAIDPRFCGPIAVAGALIPSVDQAGRYFPLTVAAIVPTGTGPGPLLLENEAWFSRVENAALAGLDAEEGFDAFVDRVAALAAPVIPVGQAADTQDASGIGGPWVVSGPPIELAALLARLLAIGAKPPLGLWRRVSDAEIDDVVLTSGPPQPEWLAALLDHDWEGHGWNRL
jgi:type VI secretion system protein ImpM